MNTLEHLFIKAFESGDQDYCNDTADCINWLLISSHYFKLTEDFIENFSNKVNWGNISESQKLTEYFIEKHADKINWDLISMFQVLSEGFIEKHIDKFGWNLISAYQKLSEGFIERHYDDVCWDLILMFQKLSEDFILKHSDKVRKYCESSYNNSIDSKCKKYMNILNSRSINYEAKI